MDSGFYAALTGLVARTDAMDLLANNLANVSTTGYKAQREFYSALTAASGNNNLSPLNTAVNDYGVLGGAAIDLKSGSIEPTGNKLDVALDSSGFLTVQTKAGIRYTRNGAMHLGPKGELLSSDGDQVLGVPPNPKAPPVPITVPNGSISISTDGTLSSDGAIVAKLNIVDFPQGTQLAAAGNSYFTAPQGSAQLSTSAVVRQGALESSNYNAIEGTVDLITVQRHAQLLQKALQIFYSDFSQAAAQDLPRVQP